VLIPAFAVGRSQEILLALRNFMRRTKRKFPVYVDGLIRNVNSVFSRNPNYLKPRYKKEILRGYELFYTNGIEPVTTWIQREKILASKDPCVIIASSGMLTGGVSPIYAERIVGNEKNLLAIVGYQDEESPGRRLLDLAELPENERTILLNDTEHQMKCKVEKYGLSAHADSLGIIASVKALKPCFVLVNHGDNESLSQLSQGLADELPDVRIEVADLVQAYEYVPARGSAKRRYSLRPEVHRIALHRDEPVDLEELWKHLVHSEMAGVTLTISDLVTVWYGSPEVPDDEKKAFRKALQDSPCFKLSYTNPNIISVLTEEEYEDAVTPKQMEQNEAWTLIQEKLQPYGLQKVGFGADGSVTLYFPTPKYAERCKNEIAELERTTIRSIEVAQRTDTELLKTKIKSDLAIEFGVMIDRDPSFSLQSITVKMAAGSEQPGICEQALGEYAKGFEEETGFELRFRVDGEILPSPALVVQSDATRLDTTGVITTDMYVGCGPDKPMLEQNMAKSIIDDAFAEEMHRPRVRIYQGEGRMALAFITPQVGKRYQGILDELEDIIGWRLEIQESARVNELVELAKRLLARGHLDGFKVGVHAGYTEVKGPFDIEESVAEALSKDYLELTGYELRFRRT